MNFRYFADWAEQLQHPDREIRGHRERITLRPGRRRRDHHAVERAADARHLADRPGARRRQHRRLKPPEWAPLTASLLADIAHEAGLPAGVFNVVQGTGAEAGAPLTRHPGINRLSFTGSVPTAGVIAAAAAPNIVPLSFELGGKSPLLVFEDSDLDLAVDLAVEQFDNAGQVCLGAFRMLVQESIADEFLERVVERASALVQGDPRDEAHRRQRAGQPAALRAGLGLRRARDRRRRQAGARRRPQRASWAGSTSRRRSWPAPSRAARSSPRRSSARC